ncbi:MAG TPA: competence protein CoiA family protein [Ktedonobacteraceae bacterium]|jgi:hypothetical protein
MPLIARRKGTNERIDLTTLKLPGEILKREEWVCQICGAALAINTEPDRRLYFAHVAACSNEYQSHPESPAHRAARRFVATYLREQCTALSGASVELEVPLREVMHIADILITFPTSWRVVHAVQLAPLSSIQLQERTNDYALAGIDVVWWLGQQANTPANRTWSQEIFGHAFVLDLPEKPGERISITAHVCCAHQAEGEFQESVLPISRFGEIFRERWVYTRQMRNDPRLLNLIRQFASRMRKPCPPPAPPALLPEQSIPRGDPAQFQIVQQITAHPVVQEALRLFEATLTDIALVQNTPVHPPPAAAIPTHRSDA